MKFANAAEVADPGGVEPVSSVVNKGRLRGDQWKQVEGCRSNVRVGSVAWWLDSRSWPANFPYPALD